MKNGGNPQSGSNFACAGSPADCIPRRRDNGQPQSGDNLARAGNSARAFLRIALSAGRAMDSHNQATISPAREVLRIAFSTGGAMIQTAAILTKLPGINGITHAARETSSEDPVTTINHTVPNA